MSTNLPSAPLCKYCYGKGYFTVCHDIVGSEDFGGEGFREKAKMEKHLCPRCSQEGSQGASAPAGEEVASQDSSLGHSLQGGVLPNTQNKAECSHVGSDASENSNLTDAEIIEALATKVMGWRRRDYTWKVTESDRSIMPCKTCGSKEHTGHSSVWEHCICSHCDSWEDNEERGFDPIHNWNHTMDVMKKISQDHGIKLKF